MKIALIMIVSVIVIVGLAFGAYYVISGELPDIPGFEPCLKQQLFDAGDGNPVYDGSNIVTIPSCALASGNTPDVAFASVMDNLDGIFYKSVDGELSSWVPDRGFNTLTTLQSGHSYHVYVNADVWLIVN